MSILFTLRFQMLQALRRQEALSKTLNSPAWMQQIQKKLLSTTRCNYAGLQKTEDRSDVSTDVRPLGKKIKENTKTASYTAVILFGLGVTGVMFWTVCRELFSSFSPNNVYSDALDRVKDDPRVQDSLGAPIKGFGEESKRRRRQHTAHSTYERDGVPHMRMQFYVQGLRNKGTVHLEARKNSNGKLEYRYLFVQLDYYPHLTIILEDNRSSDAEPNSALNPSAGFNNSLQLSSFKTK